MKAKKWKKFVKYNTIFDIEECSSCGEKHEGLALHWSQKTREGDEEIVVQSKCPVTKAEFFGWVRIDSIRLKGR